MSTAPVIGAPEIYFPGKVPDRQPVSVSPRRGHPKMVYAYARLAGYVRDALDCIRREHFCAAKRAGERSDESNRNYRRWNWNGEILEVYAVEHIEQVFAMPFATFVQYRKEGRTLDEIRRLGGDVVPVQCEHCGHLRITSVPVTVMQ